MKAVHAPACAQLYMKSKPGRVDETAAFMCSKQVCNLKSHEHSSTDCHGPLPPQAGKAYTSSDCPFVVGQQNK